LSSLIISGYAFARSVLQMWIFSLMVKEQKMLLSPCYFSSGVPKLGCMYP